MAFGGGTAGTGWLGAQMRALIWLLIAMMGAIVWDDIKLRSSPRFDSYDYWVSVTLLSGESLDAYRLKNGPLTTNMDLDRGFKLALKSIQAQLDQDYQRVEKCESKLSRGL
jgi:hypothetical protein